MDAIDRRGALVCAMAARRPVAARTLFLRKGGAMNGHSRRRFLADVGRGMLVASVGTSLAGDLGLAPSWAAEAASSGPPRLNFGKLEPLVALMQDTPPDKLM